MSSSLRQLMLRECSFSSGRRVPWQATFPLRFSSLRFVRELPTIQEYQHEYKQSMLRVKEIHIMGNLLLVLSYGGVCNMFCRNTGDFIGTINSNQDQIIQTLFYNKRINSLIVVFVTRYDNFASLRCQASSLECPKEMKWKPLFRNEILKYPGFVEFDDHNRKAVTYCAVKGTCRIWDIDSMALLYSISSDILDVKISNGVLLLASNTRERHHLTINVVALDSGLQLASLRYPSVHGRKVHLIEFSQDKLLIKGEKERMQLLNILNGSTKEIRHTSKIPAELVIPLIERRMFLTVMLDRVDAWNFEGEKVFSTLIQTDLFGSVIFVSTSQNILVISNKGKVYGLDLQVGTCCEMELKMEAENNITSISYDEDNNTLYCGDSLGRVYKWHS